MVWFKVVFIQIQRYLHFLFAVVCVVDGVVVAVAVVGVAVDCLALHCSTHRRVSYQCVRLGWYPDISFIDVALDFMEQTL